MRCGGVRPRAVVAVALTLVVASLACGQADRGAPWRDPQVARIAPKNLTIAVRGEPQYLSFNFGGRSTPLTWNIAEWDIR